MTVLDHGTAPRTPDRTLARPVVDTGIVDVDIHPVPKPGAIETYLPVRWRRHLAEYGRRTTTGLQSIGEYPPMYRGAMRADSWPDSGAPGSDLDLIRSQLLDAYGIQLGVLEVTGGVSHLLHTELGDAMCRAVNDWQLEQLVYPEPRLRAAIPVPFESPELAAAEIDRVGDDPGVVAVLMVSKTLEPMGRRRYWPVYQAAVDHGLPIQVHLSQGGGHANTGTGWTSYHVEYHTAHPQSFQSQVLSLIIEGTFDRFPELRFVFVEGNVAHFAPLARRLDHQWSLMRHEVPDLQRKPSAYIADHVWASTQPIDEPEKPEHLAELVEEFGADNVLFSTDYPHFDFDSPDTAFPQRFPEELLTKILRTNAMRVFKLDQTAA